MREIKFRGYSDGYNAWKYGFGVSVVELSESMQKELGVKEIVYLHTDEGKVSVVAESVGQYTGLKDENGREIYERDIIKCTNGIDEVYEEIGTVVFDLDECGYKVQYSKDSTIHCIYLINAEKFSDRFYEISYEIIGNIYENKNLLEEK